MKRVLFLMLVFISIVFASCDNVSTVDNSDDQKTEKSSGNSESEPSKPEVLIGTPNIIKGTLKNVYWYVASDSTTTIYFRFTDSTISYRLTRSNSSIGNSKTGNITYFKSDFSEFEYKWDGDIGSSEKRNTILVLDNDILITSGGFSCSNSSGETHICYKNLDAYTGDSVPYMGFGKLSDKYYYGQWLVFTPNKKCYKRYLDLETDELLILSGTWEKTDNGNYKIYWYKNKDRYDILKGTSWYQNASETSAPVAISLYVTDH